MNNLDWYHLFVRLVVASILVHDALYVCRDGKDYLTSCILPTFGLHLAPSGKIAVHLGLLLACLALIAAPGTTWLYPLALLFLSLKIASYSLRLANHMIFAWFLLALLCGAGLRSGGATIAAGEIALVAVGAQAMVLLLYFFAFFHKLNREYFDPDVSCATALVDFFCWDRKITGPRLLRCYRQFGIYGTVILEALIPVMLCIPSTRIAGIVVGIVFHFILALIGIVNFSMFMVAGLFAFVAPSAYAGALAALATVPAVVAAAACLPVLLVLLVVWRWTPRNAAVHCAYVYRAPAWLIQSAFGVLTTGFLFVCIDWLRAAPTMPGLSWTMLSPSQRWVLALLLAGFLLNGIGPYLGYKTEFSFAMFSNLRLDPWSHLVIPARWRLVKHAQYIEVESIEGLPSAAAVKGNRAAEIALHVVSRPGDYLYSRYFFREALRILGTAIDPPPRIRVRYLEFGRRHDIVGFDADQLGSCLPVNRYAFVMPRAPKVRHSEQGSLVQDGRARQLF